SLSVTRRRSRTPKNMYWSMESECKTVDLCPETRNSPDSPPFPSKYRYLSYVFGSTRWVDNLCQCENLPLISLENQRLRIPLSFAGHRRDMSQRLGDLLVKEKVITPEQLEQATKLQKEAHLRLASALVKLGFLSDEDVTNFLSR